MHANCSVRQLAKIPRPTGMVEDHVLVKFFQIAKF
jgi:hypothetical protein